MAHVQKPDFVFRWNGRVHLNRRGASVQSTTGSRGVRISGSEVVWRVLVTHSIRQFPLHFPYLGRRVPSHFNWTLLISVTLILPPPPICLHDVDMRNLTFINQDQHVNTPTTLHVLPRNTPDKTVNGLRTEAKGEVPTFITRTVLKLTLQKPTGYVMHQQFNIQQLYALPTLYLCVLCLSENKQRLVPLTA